MYAVVLFNKTNEVDVVPKLWLNGTKCYWPPFKGSRLTKALEDLSPPSPEWPIYSIEVLIETGKYSVSIHLCMFSIVLNYDDYDYLPTLTTHLSLPYL
mgnify:FL=1